MSRVVTHSRFQLDKIDADTLKGMGVEVLTDFPSDEEIGLSGINPGEVVLGTLTDEEFSIFVEMWELQSQMQQTVKDITARKMRETADKLANQGGDLLKAAAASLEGIEANLFQDEEECIGYFTAQAKLNLVRSTFYWVLGDKYNCHDYRCGVRSGRRFVRIAKRTPNG